MSNLRPLEREDVAGSFGGIDGTMALIAAVLATLCAWRERSRQRRHLRDLDERLLRDIGLSRGDVRREAAKPGWRS